MKQNLLILCLFSLMTLGACTKNVSDKTNEPEKTNEVQSSTSSSEALRALPDCPEGTHAVLTYEFDEFRFHRPRRDCESGFWFCTVGGHWEVNCVPNSPFASINGTTAYVWAQELENGQIEIHFPLALKDTEGYSAEDLATFNVDEEYEIYEGITLKIGDYSVEETEIDLVVVVDVI